MKRFAILCLLLAVMTGEALPVSASSTDDAIAQSIENAYSELVASYNVPSASYDGAMQMVNHAMYGDGDDLHLQKGDPFAAVLLNAEMSKEAMTKALQGAVQTLYRTKQDRMVMCGSMRYYSHKSGYSVSEYMQEPAQTVEERRKQYTSTVANCKEYSGTMSSYDEAIILVGGSLTIRITIDRIEAMEDGLKYNAHIRIYDSFDFNSNYKSSDADLARVLTLVGKVLAFGGAFETYNWELNLNMEFTIPNNCTHESTNYRWEHDGMAFVPVEAEGCTVNELSKIQTLKTDGTPYNPYFRTDEMVWLYHDKPWVVEFTEKSSASVMLSQTPNYSSGKPYLLKTSVEFVGGQAEKYLVFDPEKNTDVAKYRRHQYGVNFKIKGYSSSKWHTYRLENHVAEDGSNMIYMYLDGELIGPMTTYYLNTTGKNEIHGENDTWLNGVDFCVNYIGNSNFRLYEKPYYGYLQIWENGENGEPYSYFREVTQEPSCTTEGAQMVKCAICGVVKESTPIPALGHKEETIPGYAATCTQTGLTDGKKCTTCGDILTAQQTVPALGHKEELIPGYGATCTATGLTDGKKCSVCGDLLLAQTEIPATGHSYVTTVAKAPTDTSEGIQVTTCSFCGDSYTETLSSLKAVARLYGENRYLTGFAVADQLKANMGVEKFDTVVVASGTGFADALAGSYLASQKKAPILLVNKFTVEAVGTYIRENLKEGGMVYLLGGEAAVPAEMEAALEGFAVKRLAGANRYETNLKILAEAGTEGQEILICTGKGFADSLSASAVGRPILLVNKNLTAEQKTFLENSSGKFIIIGGESVVSGKVEALLKTMGSAERIGGANRYETSVLVAHRFFQMPKTAVLAYAKKFPDGLCGGPLANSLDAPLILTAPKLEAEASNYTRAKGIKDGLILGGTSVLNDDTVDKVFG